MEHKVAVRLYNNEKFGKTYGKSMYYDAIFNGTIDFVNERIKYLVDAVQFEKWQHSAKSDEDMRILRSLIAMYAEQSIDLTNSTESGNILCSWIKRFDSQMLKPKINGVVSINLKTCQLHLVLLDGEKSIEFANAFKMSSCKETDRNSPNFFASNYDAT
jgi:hypothetical protein